MASVTLKNIVNRFKTVTAVDNLSIEIQDHEFAVLVGPSGCGGHPYRSAGFRRNLHAVP